ncbi:MAG: type IV toxin-antitoxin system AbiEi family antitoxin domain-containing protein [Chloroflexi bacterium]|nr:type IV toxin-antitoxin system AbiEi family antitoxin domain-containing protein [Chloroflexota bacterium]
MSFRAEQVLEMVQEAGVLRPRDLRARELPREYLTRLHHKGLINRVSRGIYTLSDVNASEHHSLAEVSKKVPHGVICLLSALRFHDLTTQAPFEVWIAIDVKARRPREDGVHLRIVRFSGEALSAGIDERLVDGVTVRVYSPAKTVADCFKYRNKIGLEVALEALRECWRGRRCTMDELWHYARVCRVANVMRPYLESLV